LQVIAQEECVGAAWLSSVRAVRRGIELPNEQNPPNVAGLAPEFIPVENLEALV